MDTKQNVSHRLLLSIAKVAHQLSVRHTRLTGLGDAGPRGLTGAGVYVNEERPGDYHDAQRLLVDAYRWRWTMGVQGGPQLLVQLVNITRGQLPGNCGIVQ